MNYQALAESVVAGESATPDQLFSILQSTDDDLLAVLDAAFLIRKAHFGKSVQLYFLRNAKSGLCPEDCGYCSQSKVSDAEIPKYRWQNEEALLSGARDAIASGAKTYCIVASGRGPTDREVEHVSAAVKRIKDETGIHVCACLGAADT